MANHIEYKQINKTGVIELNKPKALNAIDIDMVKSLSVYLKNYANNKNINQVLIKGNDRAFCAGGDVKSVCLSEKESDLRKNFFKLEYELNYFVYKFPKKYLSIWNGIVMGGGVGISIYGNYRIVTNNTKFAMPESAIGFFPDVGTSYILSRMKSSIGLFITLTGYVLNYYELYKLNLATHFIDQNNLKELEENYINNELVKSDSFKNIPKLKSELLDNEKLIDKYFSSMNINIIIDKLRSNNSLFFKNILEKILSRCPMSLAITCEQFKRAKNISFEECLYMDYHLSQIMVNRNDFNIGVRDVLIDKSHNPKWNPDSITKIDENIQDYFKNISTTNLCLVM